MYMRTLFRILAAATALVLSGCGGGGGSDPATDNTNTFKVTVTGN
jgi:hypothetical protein